MVYEEAVKRINNGEFVSDLDVLRLVDKDRLDNLGDDIRLGHTQALKGQITDDLEILKISTKWGLIVARIQVRFGWTTEDSTLLSIADFRDGTTLAHEQAYRRWTTDNPNILQLFDLAGVTVAHIQPRFGWTTTDPYILKLTNKYGQTVADVIRKYGGK